MSVLGLDTRSDIYYLGLLHVRLRPARRCESARLLAAGSDECGAPSGRRRRPGPACGSARSAKPLTAVRRTQTDPPAGLNASCSARWMDRDEGIEKDRARRYETAAPWRGRCGTTARRSRCRRFLRRRATAVEVRAAPQGPVMRLAGGMALVGGIFGTTVGLVRAEGGRFEAETPAPPKGERQAKGTWREAHGPR